MTNRGATARAVAIVLGTGFGGVAGIAWAETECLDERRQAVSYALGMVFAERVLGEYEDWIDLEAVAEGMRRQMGSGVKPSSSEEKVVRMSLETAEETLRDWKRDMTDVGARYARAFARKRKIEPSTEGLLYAKIEKGQPLYDSVSEWPGCPEYDKEAKPGVREEVDVCYYREKITEELLCELEKEPDETGRAETSGKTIDSAESAEGAAGTAESDDKASDRAESDDRAEGSPQIAFETASFTADEVIEGWATVFALLGEELNSGDILELVIPPALAYGAKGVPGEVESDETLRFVIRLGWWADESSES